MSDSLWPHAHKVPLPWNFPGKNTGLPFPTLGIFPAQDWTSISWVSCIGRQIRHHGTTWETHKELVSVKFLWLCQLFLSFSYSFLPFFFGSFFIHVKVEVSVAQSPLTLFNPHRPLSMEFSRPEYWVGSHSLLRGSFWPRDWIQVSCIAGRFFTVWATRESWCLKHWWKN